MSRDEARAVALQFLAQEGRRSGMDLVLLDTQTTERELGWVFSYDSLRQVESGSPSDALAGNAPFVVLRADGSLHMTGTAYPLEHYLQELERNPPRT